MSDFDLFEEQMERDHKARVERARLDNEAFAKYEAEESAKRQANALALSRRANETILLFEYQRAGVKPPLTNGAGIPTVSLSLLMKIGWTIERVGEITVLMRPISRPAKPKESDG